MSESPFTLIPRLEKRDPHPRRCMVTKTTDGCEYISEFDDQHTAAVRHTIKYPDGREFSW